ncbi:MAG: YicC/YloC family endoribonuclease [Rubripirellula sp.]
MTQTTTRTVRSMTGQGHAAEQGELGSVSVELRTVNNRGFKCSPRLSDSLSTLENKIETLARSLIHRGTVHLSVSWRRPPGENRPKIEVETLQAYVDQLQQVTLPNGEAPTIDLASMITLPGIIVSSKENAADDEQLWDFVRTAIVQAIDNLNEMRSTEGGRMADVLVAECEAIGKRLAEIEQLSPRSQETYRNRLETKIKRVLEERELEVQSVELIREVQLFADRVDISEEVMRLASHLKMFVDTIDGSVDLASPKGKDSATTVSPTGRKLDFIIQEMFRETNTIGSKASDAGIAAHVVEVKCAIERMRELVQNLE